MGSAGAGGIRHPICSSGRLEKETLLMRNQKIWNLHADRFVATSVLFTGGVGVRQQAVWSQCDWMADLSEDNGIYLTCVIYFQCVDVYFTNAYILTINILCDSNVAFLFASSLCKIKSF